MSVCLNLSIIIKAIVYVRLFFDPEIMMNNAYASESLQVEETSEKFWILIYTGTHHDSQRGGTVL